MEEKPQGKIQSKRSKHLFSGGRAKNGGKVSTPKTITREEMYLGDD